MLAHSEPRQLVDDSVHILPVVAHLGELGGLDLQEGGVRHIRKASGKLRFTAPGGSDHQDILGVDLGLELLGKLLAAPPVPVGDG